MAIKQLCPVSSVRTSSRKERGSRRGFRHRYSLFCRDIVKWENVGHGKFCGKADVDQGNYEDTSENI